MMLTTKGRYAVMAILEMASNVGDEPIALHRISSKEKISPNCLKQIFSKLKKAHLVKAIRGPNGRYILIGKLEEIRIPDIMDAVNENFIMTDCYKKSITNCASNTTKCNAYKLWKGFGKNTIGYFENISVKDALNLNLNI